MHQTTYDILAKTKVKPDLIREVIFTGTIDHPETPDSPYNQTDTFTITVKTARTAKTLDLHDMTDEARRIIRDDLEELIHQPLPSKNRNGRRRGHA